MATMKGTHTCSSFEAALEVFTSAVASSDVEVVSLVIDRQAAGVYWLDYEYEFTFKEGR